MINIAIYDTNKKDRLILQNSLTTIFQNNNLEFQITLFKSSVQLLADYYNGLFHIIFLGINSNAIADLDIGHMIRQQDELVDIIYSTSDYPFILKSHETFPIGYLIKPYQPCKIQAIINHYMQRNYISKTKFIQIKYKYNTYIVFYSNIIYISSSDKIVTFYTLHQGEIHCYKKLNAIQKELNDNRFLKCNRSFIINMDYIIGVRDTDFLTINNHLVSIKIREHKDILNTYYQYTAQKNFYDSEDDSIL